jgi:hypothetical protein
MSQSHLTIQKKANNFFSITKLIAFSIFAIVIYSFYGFVEKRRTHIFHANGQLDTIQILNSKGEIKSTIYYDKDGLTDVILKHDEINKVQILRFKNQKLVTNGVYIDRGAQADDIYYHLSIDERDYLNSGMDTIGWLEVKYKYVPNDVIIMYDENFYPRQICKYKFNESSKKISKTGNWMFFNKDEIYRQIEYRNDSIIDIKKLIKMH